MSVRDDLRKALNDSLLTQFAAAYGSALQIGLENQKFVVPQNTPHMRAWFHHIKSKRASIGTTARFNRHHGFFIVNCYVPEDSGTKNMWQMADAVVSIFEDQHFTLADQSYVTTFTPQVVGETHMDGFYFVSVMIPYWTDAVPA